jgi:hypothetical protein
MQNASASPPFYSPPPLARRESSTSELQQQRLPPIRFHLGSLALGITGDRLQKMGKTALLPEMPSFFLLPQRSSCHQSHVARKMRHTMHQIRPIGYRDLLPYSTEGNPTEKTIPTTTSDTLPSPTQASIAGKSGSGLTRPHGGENQARCFWKGRGLDAILSGIGTTVKNQ